MALTSSPEHPQPLRVVVNALKDWVERTNPIWVEGQIIEIKRRAGAALHFLRLRDKTAEVSVSVTATTAVLDAAGPLTEGTLVAAWVKPVVWTKSGSLTFECRDIRPSGEGQLLAQLEQLKRQLQAEGLFASELKKRLPLLPRRIGLITGANSAAERDVLINVHSRWPAAAFEVRHTLVQGPVAVAQIIAALAALDRTEGVDVIVIARGGGSLEDLLPFSDAALIRAVFATRTPVVSAIGHETDTPILDLVADLRASTPTDAAKRIVPDAREESERLAQATGRLRRAITHRLGNEQRQLSNLRSRPVLKDPSGAIQLHNERLADLRGRLARATLKTIRTEQTQLAQTLAHVRSLSPRATLQRGYAILSSDDGRPVSSIHHVQPDDLLVARLCDGHIAAAVVDVEAHDPQSPGEES